MRKITITETTDNDFCSPGETVRLAISTEPGNGSLIIYMTERELQDLWALAGEYLEKT